MEDNDSSSSGESDSDNNKNCDDLVETRRRKRAHLSKETDCEGMSEVKLRKTIEDDPVVSDPDGSYARPSKKSRLRLKLLEHEREKLEKLVLGDGSMLLRSLSVQETDSGVEEETEIASDFSDTLASPERVPVWQDVDDEQLVTMRDVAQNRRVRKIPLGLRPKSDYQKYLRKKFTDVYGEPSWANMSKKPSKEEDPDMALLKTSGKMIETPKFLTKGAIQIKKLASLNSKTRNEGPVVKTVRFHPTATVALVAGLGCTASLLQVDGKGNNKLASIRFDRFPIRCARFTQSGNEFIVGSNLHSHFFTYDMMQGTSIKIPTHHNMGQTSMKKFEMSPDGRLMAVAGKFGQIHLLSAASKEWVSTLSMNGTVETLSFDSEGKTLYTYGDQGEVYVWDVSSRKLLHRFFDEGSIKGVSITVSPCNSLIATGSASGVVNLYESRTALKQRNPTPVKAVMNLVTSSTTTCFNHSSQILAIASDEKENAVKLVHLPSMTVFFNFPNLSTQLERVQDVSFSPSSGFLSIVNNKSTAYLFRLKHFGNY